MHAQTAGRYRKLALALVVGLVGSVVGLVVTAPPAKAAVGAPPPGFTLTWSDDFTGAANTGLDTSVWKYDTGTGFGTGEIETMTNSTANVFQDGAGHLNIKAIHTGTNPTAGWTSGRFETIREDFGAPAGGVVRMESVFQQPNVTTTNGLGYWPAFWMLGTPFRHGVGWPTSGEIDIMEDINGLSREYGTLHCGTPSGGPCNETSGRGSGAVACTGCQTGYHDYAVEIDRSLSPERIRWYLDGNNFFTLLATAVDATTWANAVDHPFFIIYDLAMGGGFPNGVAGFTTPTTATVSGASMNVDWVAVYNKGGTTPTPTPTATPTPTPTATPAPTPTGTGANIALGKPVTCSSIQSAAYPCSAAVDGSLTTRWSSAFSDPQWIDIDLGQSYNINHVTLTWEAAYGKAFQIQTSADNTNWTSIYSTTTGTGGTQSLAVSGTGRYIRMYGTVRGTVYGYSLWEFAVNGTPAGGPTPTPAPTATPGSVLLSQGHPVTCSSLENAGYACANAVDGNTGTRWSSAFSDPQWIYVDLGATHSINKVVLNWEAAYGKSFQIQTSNDAATWTSIFSTTTGTGGVQTLNITGSGRYVRMYGTVRALPYGYSLWEYQVFGT
jgi:hypothetical protein